MLLKIYLLNFIFVKYGINKLRKDVQLENSLVAKANAGRSGYQWKPFSVCVSDYTNKTTHQTSLNNILSEFYLLLEH